MILALDSVLPVALAEKIAARAHALDFDDGKATAGRFAREVKANDQASPSPTRDALLQEVQTAILAHPVFASATRPRHMTPLILSRYRTGQTYGLHIDDALMQGIRTDISFTLFLSDPETYDGGALEILDGLEAREVKLPTGCLILYPSNTLHRVTPVMRGERLAVVGWVQSWVRAPEQREILHDLKTAVSEVHAQRGKTDLFDLLAKSRSNLLRLWAD